MKIFKIVLGTIVIVIGLSLTAAGWAIFMYGPWSLIVKAFLGFTFGFLGIGLSLPGIMLIRGSTVQDALGGAINTLQGHGGVGLRKGDTQYIPPSNIKEFLFDIFKYTIIAICVVMIVIFGIFRAIGGFPSSGLQ